MWYNLWKAEREDFMYSLLRILSKRDDFRVKVWDFWDFLNIVRKDRRMFEDRS